MADNEIVSAQETLIEEIKRQPEAVAREVLHYLKFLECQREAEVPMDGFVADTWEKLVPVIAERSPKRIMARLVERDGGMFFEVPKGYKLDPEAIGRTVAEERESRA